MSWSFIILAHQDQIGDAQLNMALLAGESLGEDGPQVHEISVHLRWCVLRRDVDKRLGPVDLVIRPQLARWMYQVNLSLQERSKRK